MMEKLENKENCTKNLFVSILILMTVVIILF